MIPIFSSRGNNIRLARQFKSYPAHSALQTRSVFPCYIVGVIMPNGKLVSRELVCSLSTDMPCVPRTHHEFDTAWPRGDVFRKFL